MTSAVEEPASTCRQALELIEAGRDPRVQEPPEVAADGRTVAIGYDVIDGPGTVQQITCTFADSGELVALRTTREGALSAAALFFLKTYGLTRVIASAPTAGPLAYFLQQLANALAPAAIYALLAAGYALIYGITGRINLAFGDFTTIGAVAALNGIVLGGMGHVALLVWGMPAGLALATLAGMALGVVLYALVFGPLRRSSSQALLIATIGLAMALSEGLRLATGSRQLWLPPLLDRPVTLLRLQEGTVSSSLAQTLLAPLALAVALVVLVAMRRSAFGRCYRACADDLEAAALMGVDIDRTLRLACMLGGAVAGIAGFVVAVRYGIVAFGMGTLWGFKALAAAIIGGIGSLPGAILGGTIIGLLEGLWSGYLPNAYREAALFALLALILAVRPHGLFGAPPADRNPWPGRRSFPPEA